MKNMSREERKSTARTNSPMDKFIRGRNVSNKARDKIIAGMRPTRSKVIIKGGDYAGKKRGRGGKR